MSVEYEQIEEIRVQILATQQYLRVICSMQLPFESVLSMERKALGQGRRILNQLGVLELVAPGELAITPTDRQPMMIDTAVESTADPDTEPGVHLEPEVVVAVSIIARRPTCCNDHVQDLR